MVESLKIAITGASGFVGAYLTEYFGRKHTVYALSRNVGNWRLEAAKEHASFRSVPLDISDRAKVMDTIRDLRPDAVLHCAVYGGYHFQDDTRTVIDTNVNGSVNVIDACSAYGAKLINTGSSSEYGLRKSIMKETDQPAANTDYALSKALITNLVSKKRLGITLRLFSVYGCYEEPHRLIPTLVRAKIKGERPQLSSKKNVRDFIYVEDVAAAYEAAVSDYERFKGEIFNVGSGVQTTIAETVALLGLKPKWNLSGRAKEPKMVWQADIGKITSSLGWQPRIALADGLARTQAWMEKHMAPYEA